MPQHMTSKNCMQRLVKGCQDHAKKVSNLIPWQTLSNAAFFRNQTSSYCRFFNQKIAGKKPVKTCDVFDAKPLWNDLCHFLPSWDNTSPDRIPLVVGPHQHDDSGDILPQSRDFFSLWIFVGRVVIFLFRILGFQLGDSSKKIGKYPLNPGEPPTIITG